MAEREGKGRGGGGGGGDGDKTNLTKDVREETASAAAARVSRVLVGGSREEHQIRSMEMVQWPEESPVELLDLDGETVQRAEELLDPDRRRRPGSHGRRGYAPP